MRSRSTAAVAAAAVLLGAIDTYVVVLALPAMMSDVGIGLDRLQQGAPIISGFLLGYVVLMPLLGRLSDVYGRTRLLVICLLVFAAGSLVTAAAHSLGSLVAGRVLQGAGGGGLVPVTLALVADRWPARQRAVPLGIVAAVQELGSVLGPVYGGLILAVSTWRTIFWINLPVACLLAALLVARRPHRRGRSRAGAAAAVLGGVAVLAGGLAVASPPALADDATVGALFAPIAAEWLTPLTIVAAVTALGFAALLITRGNAAPALAPSASVDWAGGLLLAGALAAVVIAFATGDPSREVVSTVAWWALPAGAVAAALFVVRERRAAQPMVDVRQLRSAAAFGPLLVNVAVGAALMAALVDVPIFARVSAARDSQLGAALVLLRLLAAVPVGAVAGGLLVRRFGAQLVAGAGLAVTTAALVLMSRWGADALVTPLGAGWLHPADLTLVAAGLGFGLAIAPVNASILNAVRPDWHGVASALVVVARVTGMLVGISVLTAVGLHVFYTNAAQLPSAQALCPHNPLRCPAYERLTTAAVVAELRAIFVGAAACAGVAAALALALLSRGTRHAAPRNV